MEFTGSLAAEGGCCFLDRMREPAHLQIKQTPGFGNEIGCFFLRGGMQRLPYSVGALTQIVTFSLHFSVTRISRFVFSLAVLLFALTFFIPANISHAFLTTSALLTGSVPISAVRPAMFRLPASLSPPARRPSVSAAPPSRPISTSPSISPLRTAGTSASFLPMTERIRPLPLPMVEPQPAASVSCRPRSRFSISTRTAASTPAATVMAQSTAAPATVLSGSAMCRSNARR